MISNINRKDFFKKLANNIEMSFNISDAEKEQAKSAAIMFEYAVKALNDASEHLDVFYDPLKKHEYISTKSIIEGRGIINRFKQASKKKFEIFKFRSILAIKKLFPFITGDMEIQEIINAFEDMASDLEEKVEEFYSIIVDYENSEYRNMVLVAVENIKTEVEDLNELIYDRIIEHIDTNLIGKSWLDQTSNQLNINIEEQTPLITQLFEERQKMLEGDWEDNRQALNTSDAPRVLSPDRSRVVNFTEFQENKDVIY